MKKEDPKFMFSCDLCGDSYQMGRHLYDGKQIPLYKLGVCMSCYKGNWDGWASHHEEKIKAHLKEKGLPVPERNDKGLLPRD
jgi:hypothetical protein